VSFALRHIWGLAQSATLICLGLVCWLWWTAHNELITLRAQPPRTTVQTITKTVDKSGVAHETTVETTTTATAPSSTSPVEEQARRATYAVDGRALSSDGHTWGFGLDIAARLGNLPMFGVVGYDQIGNQRWGSVGLRLEF
jgi:hypothetical protein